MEQFIEIMIGSDEADSIELLRENNITLNYQTSIHYECDGHVKDITVKITDIDYDEESGRESPRNVGEVKINLLRHLWYMDYQEAFDFCDIISQNFVDGFDSCFKNEESKNKTKYNTETFSKFIYIDKLIIDEDYRKKGIGSAIIREIIDTIGNSDTLFAVIPYAFEDKKNQQAHKRVKSFWENLGFKKMRGSRFYYFYPEL